MSEPEFVDTSVLVYAVDRSAGVKRDAARDLVARLWRTRQGVLSTQVLAEFFVVVTRKIPRPLPAVEARRRAAWYARWPVVRPAAGDVLEAMDLSASRTLHFWDALLVVAAQRAGATVLWSENLQAEAQFGAVTVHNPFSAAGAG